MSWSHGVTGSVPPLHTFAYCAGRFSICAKVEDRIDGFSHGRAPRSRSATTRSVTRVYRSRVHWLSPFEVGITSRRQQAVTQLVRRLHGSHADAGSGGANGAGRSRTRGVGCQASGGVITRRKGASERPLNTATTSARARSR